MNHKSIFVTISLLLIGLSHFSCNKEHDLNSDNEKFCAFVSSENYDATGPLIDNFLGSLRKNRPAENLDKLQAWLEAKSCVDTATIICNSCIETNPAQSELRVVFNSNGKRHVLILDIIMSDRLKFREYHD